MWPLSLKKMQTTEKRVITRVLGLTYAPSMDTNTNILSKLNWRCGGIAAPPILNLFLNIDIRGIQSLENRSIKLTTLIDESSAKFMLRIE